MLFRSTVRTIFFFIFCSVLWGANIPVKLEGSTETQIVISYHATTSAACTVAATDNNGGPSVNDLDPSKFPSANLDLSRTSANSFRWPTVVDTQNPLSRTVFIGGHDEVKLGMDARCAGCQAWYSTALQTDSDHTITVQCNSGADTGTLQAKTKNIPLASNYPEQVIPQPQAPLGGYPQPTRRWDLKRQEKIIDPISGMLMIGLEGPLDEFNGGQISAGTFNFAYDVNANSSDCSTHNWSSPCNTFTTQTSTLASTSTVNAPLFLAPDPARFTWGSGGYEYLNDFQTLPYGCSGNCNGSGGTVTLASCLSQDSGQTCFTKELDITVGNGSASLQSPVPAALFTGLFTGWAPFVPNAVTGGADIQNLSFTAVSASGSVVSMAQPLLFNINRPAGSKFTLSSCASGANVTLTVAHVDSPIQITVQETGLNHSNCTYQDRSFGLRVWLKTPGTLKLSETYNAVIGGGANRGSNGEVTMCPSSKVTDIQVDCDGNTRNPPISGYLCKVENLNSGMIVLIQDDNRVCLQTTLGKASGLTYSVVFNPKDWVSNKQLVATQPYNSHIWNITKDDSGNYQEYVPGMTFPRDRFTYVDATASGNPTSIKQQIINLGGKPAAAMRSGLFSDPVFQEVAEGYIWYGYFAGGQNALCGLAFTDASNTVVGALNGWDTYPLTGGGCHFSPQTFGKYAYFTSGMNQVANYDPTQHLNGPFVLQPTGIRKNGVWKTYSINITAATNANPVVLTNNLNDLDNWNTLGGGNFTGSFLTCSGGASGWTAINGTFHALRIDNNTFSLKTITNTPVDSSGWGTYPGGVTCALMQPLASAPVNGVATNASDRNAAQVSLGFSGGFAGYFTSGSPHFQDGDPINFYNLPQTTQYYAKSSCTGCGGSKFDVYKDAALSIPALAAEINPANGAPVSYAEACPVASSLTLPGPIYYDKWGGPSIGDTPYIRCVTFEFTGDPCSYWAGAAEAAAYPCSSNPQPYTSQLQAIQPGDGLFDTSHAGYSHEHFMVLARDTTTNPGKLRLTLMRWYGESAEASWSGSRASDDWAFNHSAGWTPMTTFLLPAALVDASNPVAWIVVSPALSGQHADVMQGPDPGNITMGGAWQPGTYDSFFNKPQAQLSAPLTFLHNSQITWNGDVQDTLTAFGSSLGQNYPSCRHELTAPPREQVWCANWAAANIASGNQLNNVDFTGVPVTLTPVPGTSYVYKINNPAPSGVTNIKTQEYVMLAPAHLYAKDVSSAAIGNIITDSTLNTKCYAFKNGECRGDSTAGTWYLAMRGAANTGSMYSNNMTLGQPALYPAPPWAGWAIQTRILPIDRTASGVRRLTMGFGVPTTHYSFQNWRPGPPVAKSGGATATQGIWGFISNMPFAATQLYHFQTGEGWLLAKVPQWPTQSDNLDRTKFVRTDVTQEISGSPGRKVRIAFGYGENGDPASLYCTSRQETCWTSASATDSNPFVFDSEPQQPAACDTRCAVPIPAIPGRVVFYQIEITDGSRKELLPLKAIAIP